MRRSNLLYLSKGGIGSVYLEDEGDVVRKVYTTGNLEADLACARREFEYQKKYWDSLEEWSPAGVRCPRPIEITDRAPVIFRMEACSGVRLQDYLTASNREDAELQAIARSVAHGLVIFFDTFNEAHHDFHFANLLYDPLQGTVTFIDFGKGLLLDTVDPRILSLPPLEFTLGWALGYHIYEDSRPATLLRGTYSSALYFFFSILYKEFYATHRLSPHSWPLVTKAAIAKYKYAGYRTHRRMLWYSTIGYWVAQSRIHLVRKYLDFEDPLHPAHLLSSCRI